MQSQVQSIQEYEEKLRDADEQKEILVKEKNALELERDEVKQYAGELVEKVKTEVDGKEFMIDRRMINTFLVQYLNPKSDATTR